MDDKYTYEENRYGDSILPNTSEKNIENSATPYFFTASTTKLIILSICTIGLYELYWLYKNWVLIKERNKAKISPFWRGFFGAFWTWSLFREVKIEAMRFDVWNNLAIGWLAFGYLTLLVVADYLPFPFDFLYYLAFIFFIPVNNLAMKVNDKANTPFDNSKFTKDSWLALLIIPVVVGFLTLVSLTVEEPSTEGSTRPHSVVDKTTY